MQAHPWKFPIFFPPLDVSPLYSHITNSQMFLWVTDDLQFPWKGHTLRNTLYNTSVGILPVCSGRKQWSLCWSENNRERRHEQQKEKEKEEKNDVCTRGRQSSQTTALKRGGVCGMKGGNAVVSSRRWGKLLDGLTYVCTAEVADAPQSGGKAGGELPDERTITSWAEEKDKRTHADHVTRDHWWFWGSRTLPRLAGVVWLTPNDGSFPLLKRSRKEGCKHSAGFRRFAGQKMDWSPQSNLC